MKTIKLHSNKKKTLVLIFALITGIILLAIGSMTNKNEETENTNIKLEQTYYSDLIEQRLETFLKTVNGINNVRVFVSVYGGEEMEYAQIENSSGFPSDYLVIKKENGEEAVIVRRLYPEIRGVGVSCTGGDDATIKKEITSLVSAALGISTNKITVIGYR